MTHLCPLVKKCTLAIWTAFVGYSLTLCAIWYQDFQAWISVVFFDVLDCAVAYLKKVWIAMPRNSKQGGSAYIAWNRNRLLSTGNKLAIGGVCSCLSM